MGNQEVVVDGRMQPRHAQLNWTASDWFYLGWQWHRRVAAYLDIHNPTCKPGDTWANLSPSASRVLLPTVEDSIRAEGGEGMDLSEIAVRIEFSLPMEEGEESVGASVIDCYCNCLHLKPSHADACMNLATFVNQLQFDRFNFHGRIFTVEEIFRQAVQVAPRNVNAWKLLALFLWKKKDDLCGAKRCYIRLMQMRSETSDVVSALQLILDAEEAIQVQQEWYPDRVRVMRNDWSEGLMRIPNSSLDPGSGYQFP